MTACKVCERNEGSYHKAECPWNEPAIVTRSSLRLAIEALTSGLDFVRHESDCNSEETGADTGDDCSCGADAAETTRHKALAALREALGEAP